MITSCEDGVLKWFILGANKDCHGKNAEHLIIEVPVGTIIRNEHGIVVGDLDREGLLYVAAKGGAGGKGNHYFVSDTEQTPKICEYGAEGESFKYSVEMSSMAHVGLVCILIFNLTFLKYLLFWFLYKIFVLFSSCIHTSFNCFFLWKKSRYTGIYKIKQ